MYYYHTSTYYSANFDRIGRLKTDLYFKTRQSDDVMASFILFSVSRVSLRNSFPIHCQTHSDNNLKNRFMLQVLRRPVLWDKYN